MTSQPTRGRFAALLAWIVIASLISGCAARAVSPVQAALPSATLQATQTVNVPAAIIPSPTTAALQEPLVWVSPELPLAFREQINLPANLRTTQDASAANVWLDSRMDTPGSQIPAGQWIYALAAAFPTLTDEVTTADLLAAWKGDYAQVVLLSADTRQVFEHLWGAADAQNVRVTSTGALLDSAWKDPTAWAILPFEELQPRWKVLRVEGQSPLEKSFDIAQYPLALSIRFFANPQQHGSAAALRSMPANLRPLFNRDPAKLTVLVMTGTTAISRHIGERMESKGLTYPGEAIHDWLADADLTHISNEVSFYTDCPKPGPARADMRFCSAPKYIQLLEYVGADIIELTGNHNLDWGTQPYIDSLEMYRQRGWKIYGGGATLSDAKQPLLVENNGNRLAFIGCSPSGPEAVWATVDRPGSAPCVMDRLEQQIRQLREDGYLPIVTLQAVETDTYKPATAQAMPDFRRLARAGAVIVSGSQSHVPQTMTFAGDGFVHYGLGNLFFDQMEPPRSREEFIDQHVFYNGHYLGVTLRTALLEDYARPRPMTAGERKTFLQTIFSLCDWSTD